MLKKKIWANFQRIIELLPKKFSLISQNYGFGIRENLFRIPDPGVKKGTGSRIRIRNTACKASAKHLPAAKTSALASPRIHCQTGQIASGSYEETLDQGVGAHNYD